MSYSTQMQNNTNTKSACFGYGAYDHCAAKAYAKRNFPTSCNDVNFTMNQPIFNWLIQQGSPVTQGMTPSQACHAKVPSVTGLEATFVSAASSGSGLNAYDCHIGNSSYASVSMTSAPDCKGWTSNWKAQAPFYGWMDVTGLGEGRPQAFKEACLKAGGYVNHSPGPASYDNSCQVSETNGQSVNVVIYGDLNAPPGQNVIRYSAWSDGIPH